MRQYLGVTIDPELMGEIEALRGREKRSTFIEHILRLGLREYKRSMSRKG
jgi:metal-responsive CopG/Arc/MetJ family transcriptional regulator